jgi:DtxR family Mn-dependent transcriptional regulator
MTNRIQTEDALKHILAVEREDGAASNDGLAGALSISRDHASDLATSLVSAGLASRTGDTLSLTQEGRARAVHIVRAHRLLETQLVRERGILPEQAHAVADRAEHHLSEVQADHLADALGRPRYDPHGDPIPTRQGHLPDTEGGVVLDFWPVDVPGRIVHLEDEPMARARRVFALGLVPETLFRIREKNQRGLVLDTGGVLCEVPPELSPSIRVAALRPGDALPPVGIRRLSALRPGEKAVVERLMPICGGYERTRLLDLGLVPGSVIEAAFTGPFTWPAAFRVRGSVIALRRKQADAILIRSEISEP